MNKKTLSLLVLSAALIAPVAAYSQCKTFTKKRCLPELTPYTHNGQMNSAVLAEGETAELLLTFYAGQSYRLNVCAQDILGQVNFKLMDTKRNVIFDNTKHKNTSKWDFNVKTTQQIIVEISVPKNTDKGKSVAMIPTGCISILVGFKE